MELVIVQGQQAPVGCPAKATALWVVAEPLTTYIDKVNCVLHSKSCGVLTSASTEVSIQEWPWAMLGLQ